MKEELYQWLLKNWSKLTQHQRQFIIIHRRLPKGLNIKQ